jgi:hypothetical protein
VGVKASARAAGVSEVMTAAGDCEAVCGVSHCRGCTRCAGNRGHGAVETSDKAGCVVQAALRRSIRSCMCSMLLLGQPPAGPYPMPAVCKGANYIRCPTHPPTLYAGHSPGSRLDQPVPHSGWRAWLLLLMWVAGGWAADIGRVWGAGAQKVEGDWQEDNACHGGPNSHSGGRCCTGHPPWNSLPLTVADVLGHEAPPGASLNVAGSTTLTLPQLTLVCHCCDAGWAARLLPSCLHTICAAPGATTCSASKGCTPQAHLFNGSSMGQRDALHVAQAPRNGRVLVGAAACRPGGR